MADQLEGSVLDIVPDDIIRQILFYIEPEHNLRAIQLASRRWHTLANEPLLWRYHCRTSFRYWRPQHDFHNKLKGRSLDVDWRTLWLTRRRTNWRIERSFNGILKTQIGRLRRFEEICTQGYDAKDFLLAQCRVDEDAEDTLTRRYYGNAALDSMHRSLGIEIWAQFSSVFRGETEQTPRLDRALAAFDMFVLHDQEGDVDDILGWLDDLALRCRTETPSFDDLTTREQALALVRWLRRERLLGMEDEAHNYRNLCNCLIGQALSTDPHASLPLVSGAIFCSVAERLGIKAGCSGFPGHVYVTVLAKPGQTLNGLPYEPEAGAEADKMFLDPFNSDEEVAKQVLRLRYAGFRSREGDLPFRPQPASLMVLRLAQNIRASWRELSGPSTAQADRLTRLRSGYPQRNLNTLMDATLWIDLLLTSPTSAFWDVHLEGFLGRFTGLFQEDMWIVEKYVQPLYEVWMRANNHHRNNHGDDDGDDSNFDARQRFGLESVPDSVNMMRLLDRRQPTLMRRYTQEIHDNVRFKIGQVVRHKRFGWVAIVNGWDSRGTAALPPATVMENEGEAAAEAEARSAVPPRRSTVFYTCLRPDLDRYGISQDNLELVNDPTAVSDELMFLAGKFFKRFDRDTCKFVSNLTEAYPDD